MKLIGGKGMKGGKDEAIKVIHHKKERKKDRKEYES